ncbi:MAG TPA: FtsL-like putative cell division protein [Bacteroidia bacterium]|nr:FtsL-like putative cell division protein [Bacteroidia bacterium]
MANKFKEIKTEEPVIEEVKPASVTPPPPPRKKKSGIVKSLNTVFSGTFLSNENVLKHIPFILFLSVIAILYIANGYWADDKVRQVNKLNAQIKDYRSEYISTKSDLMFVSKQSEVAKSVEKLGLKEPIVPPMKIVVDTSKAATEKNNVQE